MHRDGAHFRACLESLARLSPPPLECLVVVDGVDAGARRAAEASGARVVELARRGGPARARNVGAREARGDVLLFLDADVSVPPDLVAKVRATFAAEPALSAFIGSYDDTPAEPDFVSQYRNLLHHFVHQTSRGTASTFWGGCGAIRRAVFVRAGGFDEGFREPAVEDIELGGRLRRLGHPVAMRKEIQVKHHKRWTLRSMLFADVFRRAVPWAELIIDTGELPNDLNVDRASRASAACVAGALPLTAALAWAPPALVLLAGVLLAGVFLTLNRRFYLFLRGARGTGFALRAIPLHVAYYGCCSAGLAIAVARRAPVRRSDARARLCFEESPGHVE